MYYYVDPTLLKEPSVADPFYITCPNISGMTDEAGHPVHFPHFLRLLVFFPLA
jgi:hypothetical protein